MNVIEVHAAQWKSVADFYRAIGRAQFEHDGRAVPNVTNVNALLELLVWDVCEPGSPPFTIKVIGTSDLTHEIRLEIDLVQRLLADSRMESVHRRGFDVDVHIELTRR